MMCHICSKVTQRNILESKDLKRVGGPNVDQSCPFSKSCWAGKIDFAFYTALCFTNLHPKKGFIQYTHVAALPERVSRQLLHTATLSYNARCFVQLEQCLSRRCSHPCQDLGILHNLTMCHPGMCHSLLPGNLVPSYHSACSCSAWRPAGACK